MIIHFTLNGAPQELTVNPGENVQKLLFNMGMHSVRNSDDGFGLPVLTRLSLTVISLTRPCLSPHS